MNPAFAAIAPIYYQLPLLILLISLVYSATRFDQWGMILQETGRWVVNMGSFLLGIGVVLYLLATIIR